MTWDFPADLNEAAWGIIANVNWDAQTDEWLQAAKRWRDAYHAGVSGPGKNPEMALDPTLNSTPVSDSQRCSPDNPCKELNETHIRMWDECFVESYERMIDLSKTWRTHGHES